MSTTKWIRTMAGMLGRFPSPPLAVIDADGERGRAILRNRLMFDEHILRDIGFREEVSRVNLNRFPGF